MNDKDRELIVQALHTAGKVGTAAFNALVRWQLLDGLTTALTGAAVVALCLWLAIRIFRWAPKDDDFDADMRQAFRIGGVAVCLIIAAIVLCADVQPGIRDMIAPDGAAVAWITAGNR